MISMCPPSDFHFFTPRLHTRLRKQGARPRLLGPQWTEKPERKWHRMAAESTPKLSDRSQAGYYSDATSVLPRCASWPRGETGFDVGDERPPRILSLDQPGGAAEAAGCRTISPIAKTTPPTKYDQITWLGIARSAMAVDEFTLRYRSRRFLPPHCTCNYHEIAKFSKPYIAATIPYPKSSTGLNLLFGCLCIRMYTLSAINMSATYPLHR